MTHPPKLYAAPAPTFSSVGGIALQKALRAAGEDVVAAVATFRAAMQETTRALQETGVRVANTPTRVAGLEARYLVRAGLDPAYRSTVALSALVVGLLDGSEPDVRYLMPEHRADVAAAALRGWVSSYATSAPETLAWDRQMGGTRLLVGRAA